MTEVLVVDDEPSLVRALQINLKARHYQVRTDVTGSEALSVAASHPPDLVILDLGLPDLDGMQVIHGLRGWTTVPILVLSGRAATRRSNDKRAGRRTGFCDHRPGGPAGHGR